MARSSLETRFFREQSELHFVNKELSKANKQLTNGALSHNFESPPSVQNEQQLHMDHSL